MCDRRTIDFVCNMATGSVFEDAGWPWRPLYEEAGYIVVKRTRAEIKRLGRRLITLCRKGRIEDAIEMIGSEKRKRDIFNVANRNGSTALMYACRNMKMTRVVHMLLRYGANPYARSNDGSTALHAAAASNHVGAISALSGYMELLHQRNCGVCTPFFIACMRHKWNAAIRLVECGSDVSVPDACGDTPLHIVCRDDHMIRIATMIMEISPISHIIMNDKGETPLHIATAHRAIKTVRLFLGSNMRCAH